MIDVRNGYKISIMLTEKCNLNCSHCYMSAGIKGKTLTFDQIKLLIDKLPPNPKRISITGGEPYMCQPELFYILDLIKEKFNKCNDLDIRLETNASFFYQSKERIIKELGKLIAHGVTTLRVSDDQFHIDGGLNRDKLTLLETVIKENSIPIVYSCLYQERAVAFGRAKKLSSLELEKKDCLNRPESIEIPYFYTTIDGNVSTCAWKCAPSLGNILTDSFESIINNLNTPIQEALLKSDIRKVVRIYAGNNFIIRDKLLNILETKGKCMACQAMFKGAYNEKSV